MYNNKKLWKLSNIFKPRKVICHAKDQFNRKKCGDDDDDDDDDVLTAHKHHEGCISAINGRFYGHGPIMRYTKTYSEK